MSGNEQKGEELTIRAQVENLGAVQEYVEQRLESAGCPMKTQMQISLAVEEIFVNIAFYAYSPGTGDVTVRARISEDPTAAVITFSDRGIPYNPLEKRDPNICLPTAEREIGGLGVFLAKKLMDRLDYEYRDGQNILTMGKLL